MYLRNLPNRPQNKANFTRLLLKHTNPSNKYVRDPTLPLPVNETIGNAELNLLDDQNAIVSISLSKSAKLANQCFITFESNEGATTFKNKYSDTLRVNGRLIDIQYARKDSLLALSLEGTGILHKALKTRKMKQQLVDESYKESHMLKRRLRRLRYRLREKDLKEEEILKIVETVKSTKLSQLTKKVDSKPQNKKTVKMVQPQGKKKVSTTIDNPPNKILLVQNLPAETTLEKVTDIFASDGLVEVRLVAIRNLAFIEYRSTADASKMKNVLGASYDWNGHNITIGFAK